MPRAIGLAAVVLNVMLGGCGSVWQQSYRTSPLVDASDAVRHGSNHPVVVREVPWERVEGALRELQEREAASDVHITEWPEDARAAASARLLGALQLSGEPESYLLLGWSSFATMDNVRIQDGSLQRTARRLGADYALWSSRYLGPGTRVVDRPVTIHRHGWGRYYDRRDRVWRDRYHSDLDTAWVPVVEDADRHAYVAFFVRRIGN